LCAGILLAMAQTVRAEPDPIPGDAETTADSDTTTRTRSTYDWELITDEYGVTVYPPPPDEGIPSSGPTATTKKTARTTAPFQWNPAHPDDNYTGALPNRALPGFYEEVTDEYGNVVTRTVNAQTTTETAEEPTAEEPTESETFLGEPQSPKQPFNWAIAAAAGTVLLAAVLGGIIVLTKGRKDSEDDDYIYEDESAQPEEPPEE